MIVLKPGVRLTDLQPQTVLAICMADGVFSRRGIECVVTSGNDGTHKEGSFHYRGLAVDFRLKHIISPEERKRVVAEIRANCGTLGTQYDVLHEGAGTDNEHAHIEFDPKEK